MLWLTVLLGLAFSALIFCSWHELAKVVASGHEWEKDKKIKKNCGKLFIFFSIFFQGGLLADLVDPGGDGGHDGGAGGDDYNKHVFENTQEMSKSFFLPS